jgi:membrane peptidoglycan carboxypeptidase
MSTDGTEPGSGAGRDVSPNTPLVRGVASATRSAAPGPIDDLREVPDELLTPDRPRKKDEPLTPDQLRKKKADRRNLIVAAIAVIMLLSGAGLAAGTYYFDSVPTPEQLQLPESTTVYYADGKTPMAKLGNENRTLLKYDEMNDAVKDTIVAAEDQTFWTNEGIDFRGVLRAAWNNISGGDTQGASTITQQYARVAAELKGVSYSRKLREAVIAWKLSDK